MKVKSRYIDTDTIVDVVFHLKWKSDDANHSDGYQASRINIWRDYLPPSLLDEMKGKQTGERLEIHLKAGEVLPPFDEQNLIQLKSDQFDRQRVLDTTTNPGVGRFYPKGMLKNVAGVFSANV